MNPIQESTASVDRRAFLKSALSAGALVVAAPLTANPVVRLFAADDDAMWQPHVFVSVGTDGGVTIVAHRSEMGTGIRTSLPMVVTDELGANWDRVILAQAIGDKQYGSQNTDGSRSIRRFFTPMRQAGATVRTLLEQAAAKTWEVDADSCHAHDHIVEHRPSGRKLKFAELVAKARTLDVPAADTLKFRSPKEWKYIGKETQVYDLKPMLTGKAIYGGDVRRPGMVYASIERCPILGGKVKSVDSKKARSAKGVVAVEEIPPFNTVPAFQPLGGVAVVAENTWAAFQGRKALAIEWDNIDPKKNKNAAYNSEEYKKALIKTVNREGKPARNRGDVTEALKKADKVIQADYYAPHLAHAAMEPLVATAEVKNGRCEVWAPTQNPQAAQQEVARMLGLPLDNVIINVTLLGGGFGRKSKPDYCSEAAWLARKLDKPVQVVWTREDDIRFDYYHSVSAVHLEAALNKGGKPIAWLQRSAFPSISSTFQPGVEFGGAFELGLGFTDIPYDIPNLRCEVGAAPAHTRIGWFRSVCHVFHAFAVCGFADELAHAAEKDPLQYQLDLLGDDRHLDLDDAKYPNQGEPLDKFPFDIKRLKRACGQVAKTSGWGKKLPKGKGRGFACHRSFLSYVAVVVEVEVTQDGRVLIPHIHVVSDCGRVINPDRVRSQMEGAAIFASTLALLGEITYKDGAVEQSNFHDYQMLRMEAAPKKISVTLAPSEELPAGVGEIGVPPIAPAICNAIFAATGKRIRELPISKTDLSWG